MSNSNRRTGWGDQPVEAPDLNEIKSASERIGSVVIRTPLVPLHRYDSRTDIWLKPEVLQPVGSFKLRGVYNWAASLPATVRQRGMVTTSSGNTAQALGYVGRRFGVPVRTIVPEWLPDNKMAAILSYGVDVIRVPIDELLAYMFDKRWQHEPDSFLNPWAEPRMISGHGTIGLEIIEDYPEVETVFVPVGGGGLAAGIGSAMKALNPAVRVIGVQAEAWPSLPASFKAEGPVWVEGENTICEGAASPLIVDEMYPLLRQILDDVTLVAEAPVKAAIRRLAVGNKLVVEGAGALSVAAALATPPAARGRTVCIVSGGSIGKTRLAEILSNGEA